MSENGMQSMQFKRLAVLIATNGIDMVGFAMIFPLLPYYALNLDATPQTIGWIIASFSIAQLLSSPLWGRVSDRYGRRPALLIGLGASAIAYVVFAFANQVWLLFLSRLVQGAGGGTTGVAQAYVSDVVEPSRRARALGWLSAATAAGVMIGPVIGSLSSHWGRHAPGLVAASLCVLNVLFAWKWLPESKAHAEPHATRKPVWHAAFQVLRHPGASVSRLIWIYCIGMLAFTSMTAVLALYLGWKFGVDETTIGYFFLYVGALGLVMRSVLLGPIVDRYGEITTMRAGTFALVAGLGLYPFAPNLWALAFVIPLVPVGTALLFPSTTSLMSSLSDAAETGTTMGVAQFFAGISRVIAPILATTLYQRMGENTPFHAAALIVGVVSLLSFGVKQPGRDHGHEKAGQGPAEPATIPVVTTSQGSPSEAGRV